MSFMGQNSYSNITLLRDTDANQIEDNHVREALLNFQQIYALYSAECKRFDSLSKLFVDTKEGTEAFFNYKEQLVQCQQNKECLDKQIDDLVDEDIFASLLDKLRAEASQKIEENAKKALEEYRQKQVAEDAEFRKKMIKKQENSNRKLENTCTQKRLVKIEEEIAKIRPKVDALFEEINKLRWCWFGKKKIQKEKMKFELSTLQSELSSLYQEKYRLKNKLRK